MHSPTERMHIHAAHLPGRFWQAFIALAVFMTAIASAQADVGSWQKGATIRPAWDGDFASESFRQSLQNLKAANANFVTLQIPYEQSNIYSTDIRKRWFAPTDAALRSAIDAAHGLGLQVNLMPHLDPLDNYWRIYINPGDRDGWFSAYEDVVLFPLARIAAEKGVSMITLGVELGGMTTSSSNASNDWHWRETIRKVREIYGGQLTYSAQHNDPNEKADIAWWDAVDYIGISAYHPSNIWEDDPPVWKLAQEWKRWYDAEVEPLANRFGKPVLFPEIGFKSVNKAHQLPAAYWMDGGYDGQEQANDYEAVFEALKDEPTFRGVQWWDWKSDPNAGWEGNTDFTPQHKPAEEVMRRWFGYGRQAQTASSSASSVVVTEAPSSSSSSSFSSAAQTSSSAASSESTSSSVTSASSSAHSSSSSTPEDTSASAGSASSETSSSSSSSSVLVVVTDQEPPAAPSPTAEESSSVSVATGGGGGGGGGRGGSRGSFAKSLIPVLPLQAVKPPISPVPTVNMVKPTRSQQRIWHRMKRRYPDFPLPVTFTRPQLRVWLSQRLARLALPQGQPS